MTNRMRQLGALSLEQNHARPLPKLKADRAAYMVGGKGFFNDKDKYLYPGQATYWDGEPNRDLIPLNKKAYDNMQTFLDKLDVLNAKAAKANGKVYVPIAREQWDEDGLVADIPTPDSVMGVQKSGPDDTIY